MSGISPKLQPPDSHHLAAAQGWIELGNHIEANDELERIAPQLRVHPDVLWVRMDIYEAAEKWDGSHALTEALSRITPNDCGVWVELSIAKHKLGRTQEAFDLLKANASEFPEHPTVHYNLACYAKKEPKSKR